MECTGSTETGKSGENTTRKRPDLVSPDATPKEVRAFLVALLMYTRELSEEHALKIADHWKLGTGMELRAMGKKDFWELWGGEEGWIVYRDVSKAIRDTKPKGVSRWQVMTVLAIPAVGFVGYLYSSGPDGQAAAISIGVLLLSIIFMVGFLVMEEETEEGRTRWDLWDLRHWKAEKEGKGPRNPCGI